MNLITKLVKPQVSEAVALPQIYADLIQNKGLFKYYISHFWTILDTHPCNSFVFQICNSHLFSINAKKTVTGGGWTSKIVKKCVM